MLLALLAAAAVSGPADGAPAPQPSATTTADNPRWLKRPSGDDIAAAFPDRAAARNISGRAMVRCLAASDGRLKDCHVVDEAPGNMGFGAAALRLTPKFLLAPMKMLEGSTVSIPIRFTINGKGAPPRASLPTAALNSTAAEPPPGDVGPDWLKKPTPEELHAVWPARALRDGISGQAVVDCAVNLHGLLEQCEIASETPPGMAFGTAALLLTPSFLMRPANGPEGPVPSRVTIPINFKADAPTGQSGGGHDMLGEVTVLTAVDWATAPTFADLERAYPVEAGGVRGHVSLRCRVTTDGVVRDCLTTQESPKDKGFDKAGRSLTGRFHARLDPALVKRGQAVWVNIPVSFIPPGSLEFQGRHVGEPIWSVGLDPTRMTKLFPKGAAAKGVKTGRGVAECAVFIDGSLVDCKPLAGEPDHMGFSESAVEVARIMRMVPWTQEGGPVDGADIRIPIRFNLAPDAAAAPAEPASR